jgi:hypothetical protein
MRDRDKEAGSKIAYFIDFSIQEIPSIAYIAYETGGTIYTDSDTTYRTIKTEHPDLRVKQFDTIEGIKADMVRSRIRVILYPDYHLRYFSDLAGVKHVQLFHGPNDKKYNYIKDVLTYDCFFIPGIDAYERYKKKGLLMRGTGVLIGYPKLDRVFRGEVKRNEELAKMGLDPGKKTVLYAPTWHDRAWNSSWKRFQRAVAQDLPDSVNLIVKPHPNIARYRKEELDQMRKALLARQNSHMVEMASDTVPSMAASDLLISDVSGITREYLAFKRPFIFLSNKPAFMWSRKKTALWECGDTVSKPDRLWEAVARALQNPEKYLEKIEQYFLRTFYKPDGKAALRARDAVCSLIAGSV